MRDGGMTLRLGVGAALLVAAGGWSASAQAANKQPPLRNPAILNIGFVCKWQPRCIDRQEDAMNDALRYVRKKRPAVWKIQQCNRNAGRNGTRVDWVGFNNCIRNASLQPTRRRRR
jgi:hypothetical protein